MERNAHGARSEVYARVEERGSPLEERDRQAFSLGMLLPQWEVENLGTKRYHLD